MRWYLINPLGREIQIKAVGLTFFVCHIPLMKDYVLLVSFSNVTVPSDVLRSDQDGCSGTPRPQIWFGLHGNGAAVDPVAAQSRPVFTAHPLAPSEHPRGGEPAQLQRFGGAQPHVL